jgi:hypothetical protein
MYKISPDGRNDKAWFIGHIFVTQKSKCINMGIVSNFFVRMSGLHLWQAI